MLEFFKIQLSNSSEFSVAKLKENLIQFGSDKDILYSTTVFGMPPKLSNNSSLMQGNTKEN